MTESLRYTIVADITLDPNAALLDERGLEDILKESGDVSHVDVVSIREIA